VKCYLHEMSWEMDIAQHTTCAHVSEVLGQMPGVSFPHNSTAKSSSHMSSNSFHGTVQHVGLSIWYGLWLHKQHEPIVY
jgi:hypothetical protein